MLPVGQDRLIRSTSTSAMSVAAGSASLREAFAIACVNASIPQPLRLSRGSGSVGGGATSAEWPRRGRSAVQAGVRLPTSTLDQHHPGAVNCAILIGSLLVGLAQPASDPKPEAL